MTIECKFNGFLSADAESRTSPAGKQWVRLRLGVGKDAAVQWLSVACFGKAVEVAAELKKGDRCLCEGNIKLDSWRGKDGVERHGLSVACFKIERSNETDRGRARRDEQKVPVPAVAGRADRISSGNVRKSDLDDDIPFAPEFR